MRLLRPEMAVWLLAAPVAAAGWWLHWRYKWRYRRREAAGEGVRRLSRRAGMGRDLAALALTLAVVLLLAGAMMRPQIQTERTTPTFERRDLLLILDRSISMHARDVLPSRFGRAVDEVQLFLRQKPETVDRVGLIGFAERSVVLSYPTEDMESLYFYLDWASDDVTPLFGTNIGEALTSALHASRREQQPIPPTFVVISDGDDESDQLERAAAAVRQAGIVVHCIGIGSDRSVAMPVRQDDGTEGWLRDDDGFLLRTQFDESTLQRLATITGGTYTRSRSGGELLAALERIAVDEGRQTGWTSAYDYRDIHPFMLAAAAVAAVALVVLL